MGCGGGRGKGNGERSERGEREVEEVCFGDIYPLFFSSSREEERERDRIRY